MLSKDETIRIAEEYAERSHLCSESVLAALAKAQGVESPLIPRIATGFGAGVGRRGEVCGAVSGAVMGLSLAYGRDKGAPYTGGRRPYWYSSQLIDRFLEIHSGVRCFDILGLDLADPQDSERYDKQGCWRGICRDCIRDATGIAYDILSSG